MGYLGNQPTIGAYHKLDAISTVNGQATYNLLLDSVAFTPQSANHMLVVVNGIVQSPTTNYTISGSTISFTGNLVTGDVLYEFRVFGDVVNIGTPSDATVTNAKTDFVSTSSAAGLSIKGDGTTDGTLQLNCSQNSHGVKIASPAHSSGQSYTIKLPTENIAADKIMKVASISGSGTTAIGQMSFVDAPSGTHVKLATNTVSSAVSEISFANTFADNSSFRVFYILGEGLEGSANAYRNWRFSTDGSSGDTGNYSWAIDGRTSENVGISWNTTAQNYATLQDDSYYAYAGYPFSFNGYVHIPTKTDVTSYFAGMTFGERNSNDAFYNNFNGAPHSTTKPTGIVFYSSSGNFTDGTITVYGVSQ